MQYNRVEITSVNTSRLKVLTEAEIADLMHKTKAGDKKAREALITGNLRLVLSVVQRFSGRGVDPDDLFQVGCIGLIKAVDHFDVSLGLKFSTYAVPMIIGEIRRFLRDNNPVRVSRSMRDTAYHAMLVKEELTNELHREPTVEEIAARLGTDREKVIVALEAVVEPISLYEPVYTDNGESLYVVDQIGSYETESDWIDELTMREALKNLPPREKKILSRRFMAGKTQIEVAEEIGISQAQVSRLEKSAMGKLKGR
ncbi:MAG: RNA polymerase sporulation sigma factor SigG [Clostridia bacterium]|nr:RNA polymerase sporulation sigma factor SigG [Clostridia bacterium]